MKRLLDILDIFTIAHSFESPFRKDPNGSLCFQDLFKVLPEEDAGVVGDRSPELPAAVFGGGQTGRAGGRGQQGV